MLDLRLYFIADSSAAQEPTLLDIVAKAIKGGATAIQLRDKAGTNQTMISFGKKIAKVAHTAHIPFLVNDRVEVAVALDADGLHLGQSDMPIANARKLLGKNKIIGVSARTPLQAKTAQAKGADYIGAGPVYGTQSKTDAGRPIGTDGLGAIAQTVTLPVLAIGGIKRGNVAEAIEAGADGIAVISALTYAKNPMRQAQTLLAIVKHAQVTEYEAHIP